MSPEIAALIARRLAAPKQFEVVMTYDDGTAHRHQTETLSQAKGYAHHIGGKVGRTLISHGDNLGHKAGDIVRVVSVEVVAL